MRNGTALQKWWHNPATAYRLSFLYLLITAALGTFLRYLFVNPPSWANYKYFLHAHSHVAFLGWVYNALFALILCYFIPKSKHKGLIWLFWLTQIATIGMLVCFPLQGYARESIIFSTLHIFFSWAFVFMAWRRLQNTSLIARRYLKLALLFMVISSLGPFALGPLMVNGLGGSSWYYMAIYYYLHFQYNGWFLFALMSLLYEYLERRGYTLHKPAANKGFLTLAAGAILTLSLSIIWAEQQLWLYVLAALGGVLQLTGCFYLYFSLRPAYPYCREGLRPLVWQLLLFAGLAFLLKNVLQLTAALPALADWAFSTRNFIIAFLHLVFLGIVTPMLLAEGFRRRWLPITFGTRSLSYLFLTAFVISQLELLLVYTPALSPHIAPYFAGNMLWLSATMFLALLGIGLIALLKRKPQRW